MRRQRVAAHGDEINVDGKRLAVVGNSAGANIAAVTALKCKLEGGPALKGQLLFCPETDANFETSSYDEYAEGYLVTKNMMKWFWDNHVPDLARRREVYASPLQAGIDQLGVCRRRTFRLPATTCCGTKEWPMHVSLMQLVWRSRCCATTA